MLPTPPDWTEDEVKVVNDLWGCGRHSLYIPYDDTPHRLVGSGWLAAWPGEQLFTFTPSGAHALGLTLDGDPARWCDRAEVKRLRAPRSRRLRTADRATDAGVDLDEHVDPRVEPDSILLMGVGWFGLLGLEIHVAKQHPTWKTCEVCAGAELPKGTDCLRCHQKPVHGVEYKHTGRMAG